MLLFTGFIIWRSPLFWYSNTVAPLAALWPKKIMCCSWRWVVAAPNPKDFGLFLAQVVQTIRPKMEVSSHWQGVEVSQVQHPLCLPGGGKLNIVSVTWHQICKLYYQIVGLIYSAFLILNTQGNVLSFPPTPHPQFQEFNWIRAKCVWVTSSSVFFVPWVLMILTKMYQYLCCSHTFCCGLNCPLFHHCCSKLLFAVYPYTVKRLWFPEPAI